MSFLRNLGKLRDGILYLFLIFSDSGLTPKRAFELIANRRTTPGLAKHAMPYALFYVYNSTEQEQLYRRLEDAVRDYGHEVFTIFDEVFERQVVAVFSGELLHKLNLLNHLKLIPLTWLPNQWAADGEVLIIDRKFVDDLVVWLRHLREANKGTEEADVNARRLITATINQLEPLPTLDLS